MNFLRKYFGIISISIFSLALNLINLDSYSLFGDEFVTLNIASGFRFINTREIENHTTPINNDLFYPKDYWKRNTMSSLIKSICEGDSGNGIIYETALYLWFKALGLTVFNGRLLSVITSIFTLLFSFLIIRMLFSDIAIAYLSCFLLAIHPLFLNYSHEMRPYSMALCFTTISIYLFFKIIRSDDEKNLILKYIAFGIFTAFALLSHYLTIYIYLFLFFYLLVFYREIFFMGKTHITGALIVFIISGGFMYFWLYVLKGIDGIKVMHIIDKLRLESASLQTHTGIKSIIEGSIQQLLVLFGNYLQYLALQLHEFWFLIIFPFLILIINFKTLLLSIGKKNFYFLIFIVSSSVIYAAILAINAGHTTSFHARYGIFVIPFSGTLISASVISANRLMQNKIKLWITNLSFCALLIICIPSSIPAFTGICCTFYDNPEVRTQIVHFQIPPFHHEPSEVIADKIKAEYKTNDTVYYYNNDISQKANLFLKNYPDVIQKIDSLHGEKVILYHCATHDSKILFDNEVGN